jgi:hypothetical protein
MQLKFAICTKQYIYTKMQQFCKQVCNFCKFGAFCKQVCKKLSAPHKWGSLHDVMKGVNEMYLITDEIKDSTLVQIGKI